MRHSLRVTPSAVHIVCLPFFLLLEFFFCIQFHCNNCVPSWRKDWLTDWLTDRFIDWLVDWFWLINWLIDWLTDWLIADTLYEHSSFGTCVIYWNPSAVINCRCFNLFIEITRPFWIHFWRDLADEFEFSFIPSCIIILSNFVLYFQTCIFRSFVYFWSCISGPAFSVNTLPYC